jgi:hypothetical protein
MLYSFCVHSGGKSYVTQHLASDWQGAKEALIRSKGFREFSEGVMPCTVGAPLTDADIFLAVPMTGLKHCWLMQGGRAGEYFTAVFVMTVDTEDVAVEGDVPRVFEGPDLSRTTPTAT